MQKKLKNWIEKISKCHHKWLTKMNAWFKIILQGLKATQKKKKKKKKLQNLTNKWSLRQNLCEFEVDVCLMWVLENCFQFSNFIISNIDAFDNIQDIRHLALETNEAKRNYWVWSMIFILILYYPHLPTLQSHKPRDVNKETLKNLEILWATLSLDLKGILNMAFFFFIGECNKFMHVVLRRF